VPHPFNDNPEAWKETGLR